MNFILQSVILSHFVNKPRWYTHHDTKYFWCYKPLIWPTRKIRNVYLSANAPHQIFLRVRAPTGRLNNGRGKIDTLVVSTLFYESDSACYQTCWLIEGFTYCQILHNKSVCSATIFEVAVNILIENDRSWTNKMVSKKNHAYKFRNSYTISNNMAVEKYLFT